MVDRLTSLSCDEFARELAAKVPAPGGGGAAAMAGALAVALCSMAGNFTVGKPRYADVEDQLRDVLSEAEGVRAELLGLVEADALAFEPLAAAYRIPREDPARTERIEEAMRGACDVPIHIMRSCAHAIELLERMGGMASTLMRSDVGCGAALAAGALRAAHVTVLVNTSGLPDDPVARSLEAEADRYLVTLAPRADALVCAMATAIRKGA